MIDEITRIRRAMSEFKKSTQGTEACHETRTFAEEIMELAAEVHFQIPLLQAEFQEGRCACGAAARFPGPCTDCALRKLEEKIGFELAQRWHDACIVQQTVWHALAVEAQLGPEEKPQAPVKIGGSDE